MSTMHAVLGMAGTDVDDGLEATHSGGDVRPDERELGEDALRGSDRLASAGVIPFVKALLSNVRVCR